VLTGLYPRTRYASFCRLPMLKAGGGFRFEVFLVRDSTRPSFPEHSASTFSASAFEATLDREYPALNLVWPSKKVPVTFQHGTGTKPLIPTSLLARNPRVGP